MYLSDLQMFSDVDANTIFTQASPLPFTKFDRIAFIGPVGTHGYSILCKESIVKLRKSGYKVNYIPYGGNDVDDNFYKEIHDNQFDNNEITHFVITLPPFSVKNGIKLCIPFKRVYQKIYAHCVWDSECIKSEYVEELNNVCDGLLVCSEWNRKTFIKCGFKKLVHLFWYEPNIPELPDKNTSIDFIKNQSLLFGTDKDLSKTVNYYTIGQWTKRKGITETIDLFCKTFQNNENVALIVKTFYKDYTQDDIKICLNRISEITSKYISCPSIYFLPGNYSTNSIFKIHSVGDIYISLTKSEGIGLGSLIAANYNKPVIITKYGAQEEYLSKFDNVSFIDYKLQQAEDDLTFGMDLTNQLWAQPNYNQFNKFVFNSYYKIKNIDSKSEIIKNNCSIIAIGEIYAKEKISNNEFAKWFGDKFNLFFSKRIKKLKINYGNINNKLKLTINDKLFDNLSKQGGVIEYNCQNSPIDKFSFSCPATNPLREVFYFDDRNLGVFVTSIECLDCDNYYHIVNINDVCCLTEEIANLFNIKNAKDNVYYHSGDLGDIIWASSIIKHTGGGTLYLGGDLKISKNRCAPREKIDEKKCQFLKSLLESQFYIKEVIFSETCPKNVTHDLNQFRNFFINEYNEYNESPNGNNVNLIDALFETFDVDSSFKNKKWLYIKDNKIINKKIVINRTERYRNIYNESDDAYKFIVNKFNKDCIFIGTDIEYAQFIEKFGYVDRYVTDSANEIAQLIDQSYIFIGNSSFPFTLCQAIKKRSFLEQQDDNFRHIKFIQENHYELNLSSVKKLKIPKIYHVVALYEPKDQATKMRTDAAMKSWKLLYETNDNIIPVHVYEKDYPRNTQSIGDKRKCPFLRDLIKIGYNLCQDDDDIVMITNDDTILTPFVGAKIYEKINRYQACKSFRLNLKKYDNLDDLNVYNLLGKDGGRDLFALSKRWIKRHIGLIPDFATGATDWDFYLSLLIQFSNGIKITKKKNDETCVTDIELGHVYHIDHDAEWRSLNTTNDYNVQLNKKYIEKLGFLHEFINYVDFDKYKKENHNL